MGDWCSWISWVTLTYEFMSSQTFNKVMNLSCIVMPQASYPWNNSQRTSKILIIQEHWPPQISMIPQYTLHSRMICAKFGWNWPCGSGGEDLKNLSMYFRNVIIISPWKRVIWINLNSLYPRMLCAKFVWNLPSGSGEEDENMKSLRQQRRWTTDKFWSEKLT